MRRLKNPLFPAASSLRAKVLGLCTGVALLAAPVPARAVDCDVKASTCLDSDALWPVAGDSTFFSLGAGRTLQKGRFGFGIATSWQKDPILFRTSPNGPAGSVEIEGVGHQIVGALLFSYGLLDKLEVTMVAPLTFYQDGVGVSSKDGKTDSITSNGVRSVRLGAAYSLVSLPRVGDVRGVGVVARLDFALPTGDRDAYASESSVAVAPSIAVENRLGPFVFGANLGARLRKQVTLLDTNFGSQLVLGVGASFTVDRAHALSFGAEAFSLPSLVDHGASPAQWLVGARWSELLGGDLSIHLGGGGSLRGSGNAQLTDPRYRFVLDLRYAPSGHDQDGDGIPDALDKCPNDPEDKDGFEDEDGCPDKDNDQDGIPDAKDKCPNEAEDKDGFEDDDGCPEPDRDGDGIKDKVDKCPDQPEDKNGYQDDDGCPEGGPPKAPPMQCADGTFAKPGEKCDSDKDGKTDDVDVCPLVAEDYDGIMDDDGCPEKDADEDGVGDAVDKCPLEPETIDGKDDDDGCPEPGAHSKVTFASGAIEVEGGLAFAPGSSVVTKPMKAQIAMIAQRLQGLVDRGVEKIVIEGWADKAGESPANEKLATARAEAIGKALEAAGIPAGLVKAKPGDLGDPPAKGKPNYLVTVRTKRKAPLTGKPKEP